MCLAILLSQRDTRARLRNSLLDVGAVYHYRLTRLSLLTRQLARQP